MIKEFLYQSTHCNVMGGAVKLDLHFMASRKDGISSTLVAFGYITKEVMQQ